MDQAFLDRLARDLTQLEEEGLFKKERVITSPQRAEISVRDGADVLNFCANNYLGLADDPRLLEAAHEALDRKGYGMASVRFICGTQDVHKELEGRISSFLGTEDTILYSSCFDANGGLFEALLGDADAIISDSLNHASIIDGVRLCKAQRYRFKNNDMDDLRAKLEDSKGARTKIIATDGVFSMDGIVANLPAICDLADEYGAMVMVDDCHATGFMGKTGRGTHEHHGVMGRVDFITSTLGKALGGASGGFTSGRKEAIAWLRQRSRPYLFSNTIVPVVAATSLRVLDIFEESTALRDKVHENAAYFRDKMTAAGFALAGEGHPIIPVMLGDAKLASTMADKLLDEGIYVIGFSFPVVPKGQARIRTQMSAGHEKHHLDRAIEAFTKVGRELGVIPGAA